MPVADWHDQEAMPVADWRDQEATNETIFREMNEWTREAVDAGREAIPPMEAYLCECSDRRCTEPISLSRAEYESVRAWGTRFAIALNHENPEIDLVIVENDRFATIEKFQRSAAEIARATDPRR
jgi:hypothetical protein